MTLVNIPYLKSGGHIVNASIHPLCMILKRYCSAEIPPHLLSLFSLSQLYEANVVQIPRGVQSNWTENKI